MQLNLSPNAPSNSIKSAKDFLKSNFEKLGIDKEIDKVNARDIQEAFIAQNLEHSFSFFSQQNSKLNAFEFARLGSLLEGVKVGDLPSMDELDPQKAAQKLSDFAIASTKGDFSLLHLAKTSIKAGYEKFKNAENPSELSEKTFEISMQKIDAFMMSNGVKLLDIRA